MIEITAENETFGKILLMRNSLLLCCILAPSLLFGQAVADSKPPKAVIGIMIDQMRQEFLYRFAPGFSEGGFKRLMNQGFMLRNAHYNYVPTVTGPGHASVYTGTTPAVHGIVSNEWYDRKEKRIVNCVEDRQFQVVGSATGRGTVSPARLKSTTMTDELRMFTQQQGKVIGMSVKDRGAVLPAGHLPNGAFWLDGSTGKFISSTYYKPALPLWVEQFNQRKLPDQYLSKEWKPLLPMEAYSGSTLDNAKNETVMKGKDLPVFPYNLAELRKTNGNYELLANTPFADDLLTEFAKAAIDGEGIGKDDITDFLAISYSTPDLIGHAMGPSSMEVADTFFRLDRNIEDLLNSLDKKLGAGNYVVFLTTDHGVGNISQELMDARIPAGYFDSSETEKKLREYLQPFFPEIPVIESFSNNQVFLDTRAFSEDPKAAGLQYMVVCELISKWLKDITGVAEVYTKAQLIQTGQSANSHQDLIARGMHSKISGDVAFTLQPGWTWSGGAKAHHGSGYTYDTHVPVLFFGKGIKPGSSYRYHGITDIAPTICALIEIPFPNGCTGQPIEEMLVR